MESFIFCAVKVMLSKRPWKKNPFLQTINFSIIWTTLIQSPITVNSSPAQKVLTTAEQLNKLKKITESVLTES